MRTDEIQGWSQLARLTLRGATTRIHEVHRGIADRVFAAVGPAGRPVQVVHDALSQVTYGAVRLGLGAGARAGRDLDELTPADHTHVPLHDGARHFVILATLARNPSGRAADWFGDLLVPPRSAIGDTGDDDRLAFPPDHVHRLGGLHHLDLLNHPLVYARLKQWLVERPEGARPPAPK